MAVDFGPIDDGQGGQYQTLENLEGALNEVLSVAEQAEASRVYVLNDFGGDGDAITAQIAGMAPPAALPRFGLYVLRAQAANAGAAPGIAIAGLPSVPLSRDDGGALRPGDLGPGRDYLLRPVGNPVSGLRVLGLLPGDLEEVRAVAAAASAEAAVANAERVFSFISLSGTATAMTARILGFWTVETADQIGVGGLYMLIPNADHPGGPATVTVQNGAGEDIITMSLTRNGNDDLAPGDLRERVPVLFKALAAGTVLRLVGPAPSDLLAGVTEELAALRAEIDALKAG